MIHLIDHIPAPAKPVLDWSAVVASFGIVFNYLNGAVAFVAGVLSVVWLVVSIRESQTWKDLKRWLRGK